MNFSKIFFLLLIIIASSNELSAKKKVRIEERESYDFSQPHHSLKTLFSSLDASSVSQHLDF